MTQQQLNFDVPPPTVIVPVDPNLHPDDKPRVYRQSLLVLERLRRGQATSDDLANICRRYSARIHDLKKAGYRITSKRLGGAQWLFTLEENS